MKSLSESDFLPISLGDVPSSVRASGVLLQIKALSDEKDALHQQLTTNKASAALTKISEQRRQRLKELEQQLADLKKKCKEQTKIVKSKEQSDKQVSILLLLYCGSCFSFGVVVVWVLLQFGWYCSLGVAANWVLLQFGC